MKYMTFNSSCSFAGIANMLQQLGVDTEDRQIALGMNLPYLFDLRGGIYSAGPLLQTSDWFNLYLRTLGYAMRETAVNRADIPDHLRQCDTAMLGLRISPKEKHAVVFLNTHEQKFRFINNKWQRSDAPEEICLSAAELTERLDDTVMVATVSPAPVLSPNFRALFLRSCQVLAQYKNDIQNFCRTQKTPEELVAAMDPLFRATLLDGITMLELIGQAELAEQFRLIQRALLTAIREGAPVALYQRLDLPAWLAAVDMYIELIRSRA